ncbi:hypothetical protein ACFWIJ_04235 [Streptomyces sp. NPDC127079]|uniref:hypothetical protein n=1 Tax=Streptomyces sp. NPDC127079 TaxID=3347132 RepID=UPI00365922AA
MQPFTALPATTARSRRRAASSVAVLMAALASTLMPAAPSRAADTSVTVDFATAGGAPTYHASGMIYGMTPDGSLPQDHFFKDIKWHFMRVGGAQLNSGGYATSLADYQTRWNATLARSSGTCGTNRTTSRSGARRRPSTSRCGRGSTPRCAPRSPAS